jgi:hypothetical protein
MEKEEKMPLVASPNSPGQNGSEAGQAENEQIDEQIDKQMNADQTGGVSADEQMITNG